MATDRQDSFAEVALPHLDAAYNLAHWLMRERSSAEDVVQEAMLRALTYFPGFRGDNPRAWLLQIVRNTAYAALRQRHRPGVIFLDTGPDGEQAVPREPADPAASPEATLIASRDRQQLQRWLAELPVELRECLVLKEIEELSYRDIAQVTGVPVGTVMSRLWRARQLLLKTAGEVKQP